MVSVNIVNTSASLVKSKESASIPGVKVSMSCNVLMALSLMVGYLNSTYGLQRADTMLQAAISNQEVACVQQFQKDMSEAGKNNDPWSTGGILWRIEHLTPDNDPNGKDRYSSDMSNLQTQYSAANSQNQSLVKVFDANNSTAQAIQNQNAQQQPGVVTTLQSMNSIGTNLVRILQG